MTGAVGGGPADGEAGVSFAASGGRRVIQQRGPASLVILSDLLPGQNGSDGTVGINGIVDDPTTAALEGLASRESGVWIGRMRGERGDQALGASGYRPLELDPDDVMNFDDGQSRATIWPVYHDMARPAQYDQKWRRAYRAVNPAYAFAAAQTLRLVRQSWCTTTNFNSCPTCCADSDQISASACIYRHRFRPRIYSATCRCIGTS
jgi:hypothetical protein